MNICFVSNLKENGYGESTRPYYLSVELRKRGHNILHLCEEQKSNNQGIEYLPKKIFSYRSERLERALNFMYLFYKIRKFKPDLIYVHQFNNIRWAIATSILPKVPIVFDAHTSVYFEDKSFGADKNKLNDVFRIEQEVCLKSNYIIAASYSTSDLLADQYKLDRDKIFVVENATSLIPVSNPYTTNNSKFICTATIPFDGFKSNELALEFLFSVAAMMYRANPNIEFQVLGGGTKPQPPTPNIIYTGYVADLRDFLLRSDVCMAPYPPNAVCGGIRNKVCDYLALGKAIVSTTEGIRGFRDLRNGYHYAEANTTEEFVSTILKLKTDNDYRRNLEKNALDISYNYQWKNRGEQLNDIFESIVALK